MQRDLSPLRTETFDLLVIGGGVYGAAIAYESTLAGLKVALIDRGDFAGGTSANSLKILHGGLRYLQQLDVPRMRSSIRARREWALLAPEQVRPLPCVMAAQGFGLRSPAILATAFAINDLISMDRNSGVPATCRLPAGRLLSRAELRRISGGLRSSSRGALWWDAIALAPEQLVLELLVNAVQRGALAVNYVEAVALRRTGQHISGAMVRDMETGAHIEVSAHRVMCAAGPGTCDLLQSLPAGNGPPQIRGCAALNLVLKRNVLAEAAVALPAPLPPLARGMATHRELFFVPWRNRTMIGTHYEVPNPAQPAEVQTREAALRFLAIAQDAAPALDLKVGDIAFVHRGWLPLDSSWTPDQAIRLATEAEIMDGARYGAAGLWTVSGPKFTTAREVARLWLRRAGIRTANTAVTHSVSTSTRSNGMILTRITARGSPEEIGRQAASDAMARRLEDVILRRTGLGTAGYPGWKVLSQCALGMGQILNWSEARAAQEIADLAAKYRALHFWDGSEPEAPAENTT